MAGMVRGNLRQAVYDEGLTADDVVLAYHEPLRRPDAWRANLKLERNWRPAWVEANRSTERSRRSLERITAPTLVVWGQDDPWPPLTMADVSPEPRWRFYQCAVICPTRSGQMTSTG